MAFSRDHFKKVGPHFFVYKTEDATGDVDAAGYFNSVGDLLMPGDVILRITNTNLDASNEAASTAGFHLVNAVSLSAGSYTVDVANTLALTTTDSD